MLSRENPVTDGDEHAVSGEGSAVSGEIPAAPPPLHVPSRWAATKTRATSRDTPNKLLQTTLDAFNICSSKTDGERLQAVVDRLNASGDALPCYLWKGEIVTDLD